MAAPMHRGGFGPAPALEFLVVVPVYFLAGQNGQVAKEAFRRVGAGRVTLMSTFPHSPLRTGRAAFTASGSPSVGLTQSFLCDKGCKASIDCLVCLHLLVS